MKRTTGALVTMLVVVFLAAGPALAALPLIVGTDHAEQIKGTNNAEEIRGLAGGDEIVDGRGKDDVYGGRCRGQTSSATAAIHRWIDSNAVVANDTIPI
jgi:hypothetical protein